MHKKIERYSDRKTNKGKIDWSKFALGIAKYGLLLFMAIAKLLFYPVIMFVRAAQSRQSSARDTQEAAAEQNDRVAEMQEVVARKLAAKRSMAPKTAPALPYRPLPSSAIAQTLRDIEAGRPIDVELLCSLDPTWHAWLENLTPEQARECQKVPSTAILRHLKGQVELHGIPLRLSRTQEGDLKRADQRYRFPNQFTAADLPEVHCGV